jgi:hypothetical protein
MIMPRHIVLSRKGFDSKFGGCPSPIFAGGRMASLPIPEKGMKPKYRDLVGPGELADFGELVEQLGNGAKASDGVHLDPDVRRELHRNPGRPWRPLFGQTGAAERHLGTQKVGADDLFLFFGWFRRVGDDCK